MKGVMIWIGWMLFVLILIQLGIYWEFAAATIIITAALLPIASVGMYFVIRNDERFAFIKTLYHILFFIGIFGVVFYGVTQCLFPWLRELVL